jgi:nicotinate phosphoribosyltransferase
VTHTDFPTHSPLLTDLYELTMLQAYFLQDMQETAVFSLFSRKLPAKRNYLVACGLQPVLEYLEGLGFSGEDVEYLRSLGMFRESFLEWLRSFRFSGDVHAVPEGTVVFPDEPILEVEAPIGEAQLLETLILNRIHYATLTATKAARVVTAAAGKNVVDFGFRRIHGLEAGVQAARAFAVAGVSATSNVYAGSVLGLPVTGTMAHSYIQAHGEEMEAFRNFAAVYPSTILLVDTYDTLEGVRRVIRLAREMGDDFAIQGVRVDSDDLHNTTRHVRSMLDEAGLTGVKIVVSGGMDEEGIADLVSGGAPIDGFGVGTKMGVSDDAPYLDLVYKLTEYAGEGRLKSSPGKKTLPGRKQVFRGRQDGIFSWDIVCPREEEHPGTPLLHMVMERGRILDSAKEDLATIQARCREQLKHLPAEILSIFPARTVYPVSVSHSLQTEQQRLLEKYGHGSGLWVHYSMFTVPNSPLRIQPEYLNAERNRIGQAVEKFQVQGAKKAQA